MNEFLTSTKAGNLVGVDASTIIEWIEKRGLPSLTLPSGRYRIDKKKFVEWLREKGCKLEEV